MCDFGQPGGVGDIREFSFGSLHDLNTTGEAAADDVSGPSDCDLRDSMFEGIEDGVPLSGCRTEHTAAGSRQQIIKDHGIIVVDVATRDNVCRYLHTPFTCLFICLKL